MSDERSFPDIEFVNTDTDALVKSLVSAYETMTGKSLAPASPERIFILWVADILVQQRALINWAAKQNVPRFATGGYLDSLAELFKGTQRLTAQAATTTIRFTISEALASAQLIPAGTRVTTVDGSLTFETLEDVYVAIGNTYADVTAKCQTVGASGNGYIAGQISVIVDVFPYFKSCTNTTTSAGGSDVEDDTAFYERMRESEDTYSTAGAIGAYVFYAKSVNTSIADVKATSPTPGQVNVYILMENGELPDEEILNSVEDALSADNVRPLTDNVTVLAPTTVSYNIEFTYYIPSDSAISASVIEEAVATAVADYKAWQSAVMGRDINPSKLTSLLMSTGIKRVAITSPTYAAVGSTEVAQIGTETITNGGYEDE
jgi:phage-related baseplate assembly protein